MLPWKVNLLDPRQRLRENIEASVFMIAALLSRSILFLTLIPLSFLPLSTLFACTQSFFSFPFPFTILQSLIVRFPLIIFAALDCHFVPFSVGFISSYHSLCCATCLLLSPSDFLSYLHALVPCGRNWLCVPENGSSTFTLKMIVILEILLAMIKSLLCFSFAGRRDGRG